MSYLNNAASSYPKPESVGISISNAVTRPPFDSGRGGGNGDDPIAQAREQVAACIGAGQPANAIFTAGATESLNVAIKGLPLSGGHVVTTVTEHNSVLRPLKTLEREGLIGLSIVGCDRVGQVDPAAILAALRSDTRLVVVNHASNVTGCVQDIATIAAAAHTRGARILVDASQSVGYVPINVIQLGADLLAFSGHKALYGIPGTGVLYVAPGVDLQPLKTGGTGVRSDLLYQPEQMPLRLEAGTPNLPGIVALRAGIGFVQAQGIDSLRRSVLAKHDAMFEGLQRMERVRIYGSGAGESRVPVLSFNIEGLPPSDTGYILENSFGIVVRSGLHCAPLMHQALGTYPEGAVRVSPSCFTTDKDIDLFLGAVRQIAGNL